MAQIESVRVNRWIIGSPAVNEPVGMQEDTRIHDTMDEIIDK